MGLTPQKERKKGPGNETVKLLSSTCPDCQKVFEMAGLAVLRKLAQGTWPLFPSKLRPCLCEHENSSASLASSAIICNRGKPRTEKVVRLLSFNITNRSTGITVHPSCSLKELALPRAAAQAHSCHDLSSLQHCSSQPGSPHR